MTRTPKMKEIVNSRILKDYASWIYCTSCNKTIAYPCYVTYDLFPFEYTCTCGNKGKVHIEFDRSGGMDKSDVPLIEVKNRLCCPKDKAPLFTFINKNLIDYSSRIISNTVTSYRDTFILLLRFMQDKNGIAPEKLKLSDLNARYIRDFFVA